MASTRDKVGRTLAKGLLIDVDYRRDATEEITRGESISSGDSVETYVEREPTAAEWLKSISPTGQTVKHYVRSLFPFLNWITRYNTTWLTGDLIAGKSFNCGTYRRILKISRSHSWSCRCSSGNGICPAS